MTKPTLEALQSLAAVTLAATRIGAVTQVRRQGGGFVVVAQLGEQIAKLTVHECGSTEPDGSDLAARIDEMADETIREVD